MSSFDGIVNPKTPCYECPDRHRLCWDDCEKYAAFVAENEKIREARRAFNKANQVTTSRREKTKRRLIKEGRWKS